jgi:pimeloyl-ACP methyl ester carboxylesterase
MSKPWWSKALTQLQRRRMAQSGFEARDVATPQGRMKAWVGQGTGRHAPLVVQHGIGAAAVDLHPLIVKLKPLFQMIIVPDLPGHGDSDVPRDGLNRVNLTEGYLHGMDALLGELAPEGALMFGNSLGGVAVTRYALRRPERVRALFLCSPGGAWQPEDDLRSFLGGFRLDRQREAASFVDRIHARPPWYRQLHAPIVKARFAERSLRDFIARIGTDDLFTADEIASVQNPVKLFWGLNDQLMPPEQRDFWKAHLPKGSVVEEPAGVGHCPYFDSCDLLVGSIEDWATKA